MRRVPDDAGKPTPVVVGMCITHDLFAPGGTEPMPESRRVEQRAHRTDEGIPVACGREERASEGYPCAQCGTFICLICTFRGVTLCAKCSGQPVPPPAA